MKLVQASFAKGEVSPDLYGRVDLRDYQIALRKARNMIVHQFGNISNRPGLQFIAPVKDSTTPPRLIPFEFKATDTHVIEFGHQYIRILRNDAHVIDVTKNITAITQANPGVLTSVAHGLSTGDEVKIDNIVGMTQLNSRRFTITVLSVDTFNLIDKYSLIAVNTTSMTAYVSGGTAGRIFTLVTDYQQGDLRDVQFTQTADIMTLVHVSYPPRELQRLSISNWQLVDIVFQPTISYPQNLATSGGSLGVDSQYNITAIATNGEESLPAIAATAHVITAITQANPATVTSAAHGFVAGDIIHLQDILGMTQLNNRRFTITNVTANTFDLLGENSTTYTAYSSGGNAYATYIFNTNATGVVLTWDAVAGAVRYRVFKQSSGVYGFIATVNANTYTTTGSETPDLGDTPPQLVQPFLGTDNRPGAVGFYQQRMVFGGSNNHPDTSYYSTVGNFHNFSAATPIRSDDAFSASLASGQVNIIKHYTTTKDLFISTSGAEWAINAGSLDTRFSIDTIVQDIQTNWGCNNMPPINIAQTILFVEPNGNRIKSTAFAFEHNHYVTNEVSLLVKHFLAGRQLLEWTFVRSPDPIIYMIRDDGIVLTLTYNEEQEVLAWTTWDTLGKFKSVASVKPSANSSDPQAYFVIQRIINGYTVCFIERTHTRYFADVRDCFFVDAGLSYDQPIAISGIIEGTSTTITANGHGFANGDEVDIFDIKWTANFDSDKNETQPDQLNGNRYVVSGVTANTFMIAVNSTAFNNYVEGGTVRKTVLTVTGAYHIPNTSVVVLADGNVISNLTTSSTGSLTLPRKFSRIHIGLPYVSDIQTLKPEPYSRGRQSAQGSILAIPAVTIRFKESRGLLIGPDTDNLVEMKQREFEDMADPIALLTGDKKIMLNPHPSVNGNLFLRQIYPLPMTILCILPDVFFGDS